MKKSLVLIAAILLSCNLIACGTGISIGHQTPYTTVNNFPDAAMEVVDVNLSEESITVTFSYSGEYELSYGNPYEIEIFQDGDWYTLDYEKFMHTDEGYSVKSGETRTEIYKFTRYGNLPAGHYRIVKEVHDFIETGNYTEYNLAAEFDIE